MRRNLSLGCLLFAWLCAHGALWNVVQVVGWVQMFRDNAAIMPVAKAWEITFDGSTPCAMCHVSQAAEDTARQQLPRESALGGGVEKLLLVADTVPLFVVAVPRLSWPGVDDDAGLARTDAVPVPPPRLLS